MNHPSSHCRLTWRLKIHKALCRVSVLVLASCRKGQMQHDRPCWKAPPTNVDIKGSILGNNKQRLLVSGGDTLMKTYYDTSMNIFDFCQKMPLNPTTWPFKKKPHCVLTNCFRKPLPVLWSSCWNRNIETSQSGLIPYTILFWLHRSVVRAGTKAAEGVPEADMIKRTRVSSFLIHHNYFLVYLLRSSLKWLLCWRVFLVSYDSLSLKN